MYASLPFHYLKDYTGKEVSLLTATELEAGIPTEILHTVSANHYFAMQNIPNTKFQTLQQIKDDHLHGQRRCLHAFQTIKSCRTKRKMVCVQIRT